MKANQALLAGMLFVLAAVTGGAVAARASTDEILSDPIVRGTIARGDWQSLASQLRAETGAVEGAPGMLLAAHVSLALQDNAAASALFLNGYEESELAEWERWTRSLVDEFPSSPIALYLHGDALARVRRLEESREMFTGAVARDPRFYLAYNARGVVWAIAGDLDAAYEDWLKVQDMAEDFADASANFAVHQIEEGARALEVARSLDTALLLDPDHPMARNTQACLTLARGRVDEGRQLLQDLTGESGNIYAMTNLEKLDRLLDGDGEEEGEGNDLLSRYGFRFNADAKLLTPTPVGLVNVGIGMDYSRQHGGVYFSTESVEIFDGKSPSTFATHYLLAYPRGWVEGSVQ